MKILLSIQIPDIHSIFIIMIVNFLLVHHAEEDVEESLYQDLPSLTPLVVRNDSRKLPFSLIWLRRGSSNHFRISHNPVLISDHYEVDKSGIAYIALFLILFLKFIEDEDHVRCVSISSTAALTLCEVFFRNSWLSILFLWIYLSARDIVLYIFIVVQVELFFLMS